MRLRVKTNAFVKSNQMYLTKAFVFFFSVQIFKTQLLLVSEIKTDGLYFHTY